jgi:glutamyl-tRNA(Gln) amidotransferase subunit E
MTLQADSTELSINQIRKKLNLESISVEDLKKLILEIVNTNSKMIKEKGIRAKGALMGVVMKKVRGKIDGAIVSKELENALKEKIEK